MHSSVFFLLCFIRSESHGLETYSRPFFFRVLNTHWKCLETVLRHVATWSWDMLQHGLETSYSMVLRRINNFPRLYCDSLETCCKMVLRHLKTIAKWSWYVFKTHFGYGLKTVSRHLGGGLEDVGVSRLCLWEMSWDLSWDLPWIVLRHVLDMT